MAEKARRKGRWCACASHENGVGSHGGLYGPANSNQFKFSLIFQLYFYFVIKLNLCMACYISRIMKPIWLRSVDPNKHLHFYIPTTHHLSTQVSGDYV